MKQFILSIECFVFDFILMVSFLSNVSFVNHQNRNHGPYRNHWLLILSGVSIRFMVFAFVENRIQLEEIFHKSTVAVNQWISWRSLHIRIILDIFVWNGSCLLSSQRTIQRCN